MSQEIFKTCAGQVLRRLCMEVMAAGGLEGGAGRLGGRAKALPLGRGNSRHGGLGDLGGLRQTNLVRKERLGVQGVGGGRQAGLVHRIRGEVGNLAAQGGTRVVMKASTPGSGRRSLFWGARVKEELGGRVGVQLCLTGESSQTLARMVSLEASGISFWAAQWPGWVSQLPI